MKELPPGILAELVRRLVEGLAPEKIFLFGSHAWGTPTADSDLDIMVVVGDSAIPSHKRAQQAYRLLRGMRVPKDIVVLTRRELERQMQVPASLGHRVLSRGISLYG